MNSNNSNQTNERKVRTRQRKPVRAPFHDELERIGRGDNYCNWHLIGVREIKKRELQNGSLRLKKVIYKISQSITAVHKHFNLERDPCVVYQLCEDKLLMELLGLWESKLISNWKGPNVSKSGVCDMNKLWEGKKGYWKLCKNWADQNKWSVNHMFWIPVLTHLLELIHKLSVNQFPKQINLQKAFEDALKYPALLAIFRGTIRFPKTRALPLLINTTLTKNRSLRICLRDHIDAAFAIFKWKEQESERCEREEGLRCDSSKFDKRVSERVKERAIEYSNEMSERKLKEFAVLLMNEQSNQTIFPQMQFDETFVKDEKDAPDHPSKTKKTKPTKSKRAKARSAHNNNNNDNNNALPPPINASQLPGNDDNDSGYSPTSSSSTATINNNNNNNPVDSFSFNNQTNSTMSTLFMNNDNDNQLINQLRIGNDGDLVPSNVSVMPPGLNVPFVDTTHTSQQLGSIHMTNGFNHNDIVGRNESDSIDFNHSIEAPIMSNNISNYSMNGYNVYHSQSRRVSESRASPLQAVPSLDAMSMQNLTSLQQQQLVDCQRQQSLNQDLERQLQSCRMRLRQMNNTQRRREQQLRQFITNYRPPNHHTSSVTASLSANNNNGDAAFRRPVSSMYGGDRVPSRPRQQHRRRMYNHNNNNTHRQMRMMDMNLNLNNSAQYLPPPPLPHPSNHNNDMGMRSAAAPFIVNASSEMNMELTHGLPLENTTLPIRQRDGRRSTTPLLPVYRNTYNDIPSFNTGLSMMDSSIVNDENASILQSHSSGSSSSGMSMYSQMGGNSGSSVSMDCDANNFMNSSYELQCPNSLNIGRQFTNDYSTFL